MSDRPQIPVQPRQVSGKAVARLRREGLIPAVVYGQQESSQPLQLDAREFELMRRTVGRNALVDLALDGGRPRPVMLHAIQEHPVTRKTLHVDFLVVNMREELTVDVPLTFAGTSIVVENEGGTLLHVHETVQVRALPADLPTSLEMDISSLDSFDSVLTAAELVLPERVTLVTDTAEVLARVQPPRVEEEPVVAEAELGAEAAEEGTEDEGDGAGGSSENDEG